MILRSNVLAFCRGKLKVRCARRDTRAIRLFCTRHVQRGSECDEISTGAKKNLRASPRREALFIFVSFICLLLRAAFVASVTYSSYKSRRCRKRILTKLKRYVLLLPIVSQFIPSHSPLPALSHARRGGRRHFKGAVKRPAGKFDLTTVSLRISRLRDGFTKSTLYNSLAPVRRMCPMRKVYCNI